MELEKVTSESFSLPKRLYDDACGMAFALELVGERWVPLILRELMFGPRRFGDSARLSSHAISGLHSPEPVG